MTATPLIVFAHADEAECFAQAGVPHLVTGVGKINATLPKGKDPQTVTMDEALALIAEKEAKGGGGKKPFRKAAASGKPAAKKTAAKKPAAKKKE